MADFKVLIIDDEPLAGQKVRRFLQETTIHHPPRWEIETATNAFLGLEKINSMAPDLIILDIQMPGMTGMEMLQQLDKRHFKIIFATAYEEFAVRAFLENACDYLLKPFDQKRFDLALEKVLVKHHAEKKLQGLETFYQKEGKYLEKIVYRAGEKTKFLDIEQITHFESREHFTYAHTLEGEKLIDLSLKNLESRISPQKFMRIHRHAIVAIDHIQEIKKGISMSVLLKNGAKLSVSRNCQKKLLNIFKM